MQEDLPSEMTRAVEALVATVRSGRFPRMRLDRVNGGAVLRQRPRGGS